MTRHDGEISNVRDNAAASASPDVNEYLSGLRVEDEQIDVTYFPGRKRRPAVRTSLWRTLWYVAKGRRVYVR